MNCSRLYNEQGTELKLELSSTYSWCHVPSLLPRDICGIAISNLGHILSHWSTLFWALWLAAPSIPSPCTRGLEHRDGAQRVRLRRGVGTVA